MGIYIRKKDPAKQSPATNCEPVGMAVSCGSDGIALNIYNQEGNHEVGIGIDYADAKVIVAHLQSLIQRHDHQGGLH